MGAPIGQARVDVEMRRQGSTLAVLLAGNVSNSVKLRSRANGAALVNGELRIPLPAAEVGIAHGLPEPGAVTSQMKVIHQQASSHSLRLQLSAPANSHQTMFLRLNDPKVHPRVEGAEMSIDFSELRIQFPAGAGYVEQIVTLSW